MQLSVISKHVEVSFSIGVHQNHPLNNRFFHQKNHPAIGVLPFMETPSCASLKEEGLVIFTRAGIGEEGNLSPSSTIFHGEQGLQMVHAKNVPANFSSWVPCIKSM
jgi:hypothetical protein